MPLVHTSGYRQTEDIDFEGTKSASQWERLATVCVSRARDALARPTGTYTKVHLDTISDLLRALLVTQGSIEKLLEGGSQSPQAVDALVLARLQLLAHAFTIEQGGIEDRPNYIEETKHGPQISLPLLLDDFARGWSRYLQDVLKAGENKGLGKLFEQRFGKVFFDR